MDRLMKLILFVISIYMTIVTVMFVKFLMDHTMYDGTTIVMYLIILTIGFFMLTFLYDKNISKYIAFPLYGIILLGVKTFYDIFIDISDLPFNSTVKHDFNYYIYYTHFSTDSFHFKIQYSYAFLFIALAGSLISLAMYLHSLNKVDETGK